MSNSPTIEFECVSSFDPCYGLPIHRVGQKIKVKKHPAVAHYNKENRVIDDCSGKTLGFGWVISDADLKNHFKQISSS
jgi:hypothetical protein